MPFDKTHITEGYTKPTSGNVVGEIIGATNTVSLSKKLSVFQSPVFFQIVSDIVAIVVCNITFYFLKILSPEANPVVQTWEFFATFILAGLTFGIVALWLGGLYKNWYIRSPFDEFFTIIKAVVISGIIPVLIILIENGALRYKLLFFLGLLVFSLCTFRFIARQIQRRLRIKGIITLPTVIVGCGNKVKELFKQVQSEPAWGYDIQGVVLTSAAEMFGWNNSPRFIGEVTNIESILDSCKPGVVLLALDSADHEQMLRIASHANDRGISVKIVPDLYEIVTGQVKTLQIYGSPLIEVNPELLKPWEEAIKRLIDIVFSAAVIVLGLPVWLLIVAIIKIESRGPALFKQKRVGKNGHVFWIYKFRSMVQDAEKHGQQWTVVGDPRVTKFGWFIRKTHIDEIPQMWNILKGEMSLVGPRPEQPKFVEKYNALLPYYNRRHRVRPGLTGWWQIKYTTYEESIEEIEHRLRYDFFYIENMSLKLDIEIIVRTVFVVLSGHGQA